MINDKKCEGYPMNCIGKTCSFNGLPLVEYTWLEKRKFINFSCNISPVSAHDASKLLFGQKCFGMK